MSTKLSIYSGRAKKSVDMKYVYGEIQKGRSILSIAEELHVSRATIYRRHHEYQKNRKEEIAWYGSSPDVIYPELGENPFA